MKTMYYEQVYSESIPVGISKHKACPQSLKTQDNLPMRLDRLLSDNV